MPRRVLEAWLGGEAGPDAVARILLGEAEPSGRLPVTFPAAPGGHARRTPSIRAAKR